MPCCFKYLYNFGNSILYYNKSLSLPKLGVPSPVTIRTVKARTASKDVSYVPGPHPFVAYELMAISLWTFSKEGRRTLNPVVPQPELCPTVMSLKPPTPLEYSRGFKKPRGGCFLERRTSLRSATTPANAGEDAEVPPISLGLPDRKIRKRSDCAETSG